MKVDLDRLTVFISKLRSLVAIKLQVLIHNSQGIACLISFMRFSGGGFWVPPKRGAKSLGYSGMVMNGHVPGRLGTLSRWEAEVDRFHASLPIHAQHLFHTA